MDITPTSLKARVTSIQMLMSRGVEVPPEEKEMSLLTHIDEKHYLGMIEYFISILGSRESDFRIAFSHTKNKNKVNPDSVVLLQPGEEDKSDKIITSVGKFLNLSIDQSKNNTRLLSNIYYSDVRGERKLLLLYFSGSDQYNQNESSKLTESCSRLGITNIIVVTKYGTTSTILKNFAKDVPRYVPAGTIFDGYVWQHFQEKELQNNVSRLHLQPKNIRVLSEEERLLLKASGINPTSLTSRTVSDPLIKYYGFGIDDIITFVRDIIVPECIVYEEIDYIRVVDDSTVKKSAPAPKSIYV